MQVISCGNITTIEILDIVVRLNMLHRDYVWLKQYYYSAVIRVNMHNYLEVLSCGNKESRGR